MPRPIIEARNLKKHFPITRGLLFARKVGSVKAVDGIDLQIWPGQTFSLVGESGCGKTTTTKMILRLEKATSGTLRFEGHDIDRLSGPALKTFRGDVQAVFQDPYSSLNPRMRIGDIVSEPLIAKERLSRAARLERVALLLESVGLSPTSANLYPHETSGGQRQRIAVARALSVNPRLIILDEPVSALDVSTRAQIMNLLMDLQKRFGLAYMLIAHDLSTVRYMSTFVAVMYLGKIVEAAPSEELFTSPRHPYTQALLSAALPSHPSLKRERVALEGEIPSPVEPPSGCSFHPRCPVAFEDCSRTEPELLAITSGHTVACLRVSRQGGPQNRSRETRSEERGAISPPTERRLVR
jgi:oligopeptide/dipeptide ABC transporter ATP-binding protein